MTFAEWVRAGVISRLGGHHIFHREFGPRTGPPVTLIHGFPTSSHDWAEVIPALQAVGCRVIVLDLLGFGASDKPRRYRYTLAEQASLVEALWEQLGVGETALVSHDYGVSVAQELIARDAGRIARAAFLNGGLYPDLHRPIAVQRLLHGPAGVVLGPLSSAPMYARSLREILGRPVSDAALNEMWKATSAGGGRWVQHALLRYIDERREFADRWRTAFEGYGGPLQFIWGPADPISGAHVLERLAERFGAAEFVVLDTPPVTGHYPQVENPAAVAEALSRFLTPS